MKKTQVFTFSGDSIAGLVHSQGEGVDLLSLGGESQTQRYSEVCYITDETVAGKLNQEYCKEKGYGSYNVILIKWGKYVGELLTSDMYYNHVGLFRHNYATHGRENFSLAQATQMNKVAGKAPELLKGHHIDDVDDVMIFNDYKGAQAYEVAFSQMLALTGVNKS